MTKSLSLTTISVATVAIMAMALFLVAAFPAHAQTSKPLDECTLAKNITIGATTYLAGSTVGAKDSGAAATPENWSLICLLNTVYVITDWVFIILLALAIGLIALGGFFWITSGAAPEQKKLATTMITAAIVGFLIALLAKFIPALITGLLF